MAIAIYLNTVDLAQLHAACSDPSLSGADRTLAQRVLTNGLSAYATAPLAPADKGDNDPDCRRLVVSTNQVTLVQVRDFLNRRAGIASRPIFAALAKDMRGISGAEQL